MVRGEKPLLHDPAEPGALRAVHAREHLTYRRLCKSPCSMSMRVKPDELMKLSGSRLAHCTSSCLVRHQNPVPELPTCQWTGSRRHSRKIGWCRSSWNVSGLSRSLQSLAPPFSFWGPYLRLGRKSQLSCRVDGAREGEPAVAIDHLTGHPGDLVEADDRLCDVGGRAQPT